MDKYEFNIKVEQIKKLVNKSDYETAMKIADTIDWRRVRNVNILSMVAGIYEKNGEFQEAKDILLLAFERAPIGKRLLYKLADLALKEGNVEEAEDYYKEFCNLAADDPRQYILRYMILKAKGAPVEQLIHTLEQYCNAELDEKWMYELAELYNQAGMEQLCVMTCDKIMLMFGLGKYVDKAMELKLQYAPLNQYQMDLVENKEKYEAKLKAVEQEYKKGTSIVQPIENTDRRQLDREEEPVEDEEIEEEEEEIRPEKIPYDFSSAGVDMEQFPYHIWRKLLKEIMINDNSELFQKGNFQGDLELRKAIMYYLRQSRGVHVHASQIVVAAGMENLLFLLRQILGEKVSIGIENPVYKNAYEILKELDFKIHPSSMVERGMCV